MTVCDGTVSVDVENAACPLPLRAVGPASVVAGAAHVPPSMKVTLPVVTAVAPTFTEAVNVTLSPNVEGFAEEASVVVVFAFELNVTVSAGLLPSTALHGFVVPVHVELLRLAGALQPAKTDPLVAVALKVVVARLTLTVMSGEHVPVTVCDGRSVPVPPHDTGALIVPVLTLSVTEPVPVPAGANVRASFRESVNVICARDCAPCAVR